MSAFNNKSKEKFLAEFPTASIESANCNLSTRCKFNFSYFDATQPAGQDFCDWSLENLVELLYKLKEFSKESLKYWETQGLLVNYKSFPRKSDFTHPKHVPHQVHWGRFRLGGATRLAGFMVPGEFHDTSHRITGVRFDSNTFYVVFLDSDHKFYKLESR